MDVLQAIMTRRSIRSFTGEPIGEGNLEILLKAGFAAPSAHNYQPWNFVVVRDKEILKNIADFHTYGKMATKAGCAIVVCGDTEKQPMTGFLVEDCSAAIQNMLLAAHGLGLGAVWCGIYPVLELTESMAELLKLPPTVIPVGMVVVGHKTADKEPANRYDAAKVHYDRW